MTPYALWAYVSEMPEHRLLRLADIGTRRAHYTVAGLFPDRYPGHSGSSMNCSHADCRALQAAIWKAVQPWLGRESALLRTWNQLQMVTAGYALTVVWGTLTELVAHWSRTVVWGT